MFSVLQSRTLLFIHSKWNSLHLLTPNSQSIPLPPPLVIYDGTWWKIMWDKECIYIYVCVCISVLQQSDPVKYVHVIVIYMTVSLCCRAEIDRTLYINYNRKNKNLTKKIENKNKKQHSHSCHPLGEKSSVSISGRIAIWVGLFPLDTFSLWMTSFFLVCFWFRFLFLFKNFIEV